MMQGQKNSFESLPDSVQFDCGSNSNSSDMDQPIYQSNLNPAATPTLADFLLSPTEENVDYMTVTPQSTDLSIWNSGELNTNPFAVNQDETKISDGWNSALSISSASNQLMEERCCERTNLSLENVGLNLNLNNTPVDEGHAFSHISDVNNVSQSAAHMCSGPCANNAEVSLCPFMPEFLEAEDVPCSNSNGSSSSGVGSAPDDDLIERSSSRLLACKRKNMEGAIGESSTSHISADMSISRSSMYLTAASSLEEIQSPSSSRLHRGGSSEWYSPSSLSRNVETPQRNLRPRLSLSREHDISSTQSHFVASSNRLSNDRSSSEPSSIPSPFINLAEQNQPHLLPVSVLPHHIHRSSSISRISNSSISAILQRRVRLIAAHEEENISLPTNGVTDYLTFSARTGDNHMVQDPTNTSNSDSSMSLNRVGSSSGFIPLTVSMREPSEAAPVQYPGNLAEAVRSSFPFGGSEPGHLSSTLPLQHSSHSDSSQEPGQSSRAVWQGHSQPHPRTGLPNDRPHGHSALPLSARSQDRRMRMISELRNALELIRRGGNLLHFEDVFFFDQSGFYGHHDFLDRHRDLRLDVDNMSYEELLTLEERIGSVSTGLCEQVILKCLRKQIYSSCKFEIAAGEQEPCCICQEDYMEGDDIGILDCGHDFHTACIKQWLLVKNLCPVCKTTALDEGHTTMSDETK